MSTTVETGSIVTLKFAASDSFWVRARQASVIEHRLEQHKNDFYVHSANYYEPAMLIFKVRVLKDASKIWTEAKIANLINSYNPTGYYLALKEKAHQIVTEVIEPGLDTVAYTALVVVLLFLGYKIFID
jgi:hypothetical protein